jgi:hypothetical protein
MWTKAWDTIVGWIILAVIGYAIFLVLQEKYPSPPYQSEGMETFRGFTPGGPSGPPASAVPVVPSPAPGASAVPVAPSPAPGGPSGPPASAAELIHPQ